MTRSEGARVREIMSCPVVAVRPTEPVAHAKKLMLRHGIGRLLVMELGRPVGILSMRDLANSLWRGVPGWKRRPIDQLPIGQVMHRGVITIPAGTRVEKAAQLMLKHGISSLVVVENGGGPAGIVTKTDLTRYFAERMRGKLKVVALMTPNPVVVGRTHSISQVIGLMQHHRITRVIVTDGENPIGIITERDIGFAQLELPWRGPKFRQVKYTRRLERGGRPRARYVKYVGLLTAEDVMTPDPLTIEIDADASEAARLVLSRGISGLPVVDRGKLTGILTKTDLVRGIAVRGGQ